MRRVNLCLSGVFAWKGPFMGLNVRDRISAPSTASCTPYTSVRSHLDCRVLSYLGNLLRIALTMSAAGMLFMIRNVRSGLT